MPGLINLHIHVQGHRPATEAGAEPLLAGTSAHFLQASLRDTLRMGVTTLRNVGSQDHQPQEARQAMRYGAFRGPRLLTCGLIISATAPGGRFYGAMYREANGPDEMRKAVREQLREGADFIKVMTTGARSNELEDPDPMPADRPRVRRAGRRGPPDGRPRGRPRRGPGRHRRGHRPRDGHDRARHVPQPAPRAAGAHGAGRADAHPHAGRLLLDGGHQRGDRPRRGDARPDMLPRLVELANYNLEQGTPACAPPARRA